MSDGLCSSMDRTNDRASTCTITLAHAPRVIYLPVRKIRSESCELTSPVSYQGCASRPYLSYRNLQTSVGLVVAMIQVSYTMPTCGVSRMHSAITINPEGVALGINGYCFMYSRYTTGRHGITYTYIRGQGALPRQYESASLFLRDITSHTSRQNVYLCHAKGCSDLGHVTRREPVMSLK